jgi:hypothetical protein
MREKLFAFLAALALTGAAAKADPTVQLYITTVNATPTGGTWQVYAQDSNDNDGLAQWDIDVLGGGGAVVNSTATLQAPRPRDLSGQYAFGPTMGFNQVYHGTISGTNLVEISALQTYSYGNGIEGQDDPTYDMGILVGIGQENSDASPQNGTQGPWDGSGTPTGIPTPVWNYTPLTTVSGRTSAPSYQIAGTLIEQGTYTTSASQGSLTVQSHLVVINTFDTQGMYSEAAFMLATDDGGMNEPWDYSHQKGALTGTIPIPDTIPLSVPEPGSFAILAIIAAIVNLKGRWVGRKLS